MIINKFLAIVVLGLFLSGCFQDKTKVALENCADSILDRQVVTQYDDEAIKAALMKSSKIKIIDKEYQALIAEEDFIRNKIYAYIDKNLLENFFDKNGYNNKIFMFSIGAKNIKDLEIKHSDLKFKPNETKKNEISKYLGETIMTLANVKREASLLNVNKRWSLYQNEFKKLKLSIKMKAGAYSQKYLQCELESVATPNTFKAKWSE